MLTTSDLLQRLSDAYKTNPARAFNMLPEIVNAIDGGRIIGIDDISVEKAKWIIGVCIGVLLGQIDAQDRLIKAMQTHMLNEAAEAVREEMEVNNDKQI